jgi:DNA polymerase-3 subunit gamma/tau
MTLLRLLAFEPVAEPGNGGLAAAPDSGAAVRAAPIRAEAPAAAPPAGLPGAADWPAFVAGMKLSGIALQLAAQSALKTSTAGEIVLAVPEAARHLTDKPYADKLKTALEEKLGRRVRLRFDVEAIADPTLAAQEKREREAARASTEAAFRDDPFVQDVLSRFDARIKPNSVKPV